MITVNCQSSIRITSNDIVVYFDPLNIDEALHDADVIFVTHAHWDHFSPEDITKVKKPDTIIVVSADLTAKAMKLGFADDQVITVAPNQELIVRGLNVKTVPAYNLNKDFHPKANNWVGYVVNIDGTIYHAMGDTDALPENESIVCDVLLIPIGGTYTMNAGEAAAFTNKLKPRVVVPIHYGMVVGNQADCDKFASLVDGSIAVEQKIKL